MTKNIAVQMDVLPLGSGTAELLTRVPSASRVSLVLFSLATYPTFFFFFKKNVFIRKLLISYETLRRKLKPPEVLPPRQHVLTSPSQVTYRYI